MDKDLEPLSNEEITEKLKNFSGWKYADNKISKEFEFPSFMTGLHLINELAKFCEKIDHHPDIHIRYRKILFELTRFSVGGKITERDFKVAQKIESLFREIK